MEQAPGANGDGGGDSHCNSKGSARNLAGL